jgi:hypothetical protein
MPLSYVSVDDHVGQLGALFAVEPLHRRDHPDHQQRDEQDQADVLDRPLTALAGEDMDRLHPPGDGEVEPPQGGVGVAQHCVEHRSPFFVW